MIPKNEGVEKISEFRPISLVGSTYKIKSKCLALWLIEVLLSLVPKGQCAFLKSRNMVDGVLCANEVIDARIREGWQGWWLNWTLKKLTTMSIGSFFHTC